MLTIRFARTGRRNRAQFQIVLQEHTVAPGGRHVEVLGSHDPHLKKTVLKEERIKYWLSQGVQASDTAFNLLLAKGLASGDKRKVKMPARDASSSENTVENLGQNVTSEESTNTKEHNEAGGPAKKVVEVPAEAAAPVEAKAEEAPATPKEEPAASETKAE
jgi:small subunit ribosomal protein S16